jgi:hypothetical protein
MGLVTAKSWHVTEHPEKVFDANDAPFRDLELVAIHVEPALALTHDVNLLIPLVGMDEGHTDPWWQFIDGDRR